MRALVAMSGGVDSSVAAALLLAGGHEVVGATMKLWGGPSDSGCCSVADVEDARRVCQQLGIAHHVFNFTAEFEEEVVAPYVEAHAAGMTPNPCISCNAHLKFDRFWLRARHLGFDAIATGHHARVTATSEPGPPLAGRAGSPPAGPAGAHGDCPGQGPAGPGTGRVVWRLRRGQDLGKDQSYVLYMLGQAQLAELLLPVGEMTKDEVRRRAATLGLRTAAKPDSQDVCFISRTGGRQSFLGDRIPVRGGRLLSAAGADLGEAPDLELLTVGQRRGLGPAAYRSEHKGTPERRYVVGVDLRARTATLGTLEQLLVGSVRVGPVSWAAGALPAGARAHVQTSAHGRAFPARWEPAPEGGGGRLVFEERIRKVAAGQAVVMYRLELEGDVVLGGATALP
jgi:tRNA-specific 2-thiouridylase